MSAIAETSACPVTGVTTDSLGCLFSTAIKDSTAVLDDPMLSIPKELRDVTLSEEQKTLIKASIPALESHGLDITRSFYEKLILDVPSLNNIFNKVNQVHLDQPKALANAVYAYAANIDDLTPLLPAVAHITNKHASLHVRPEQYEIVGTYLLQAIQNVLGDAITPELLAAWKVAYWQLAKIMMLEEDKLYREKPGASDWNGFKIIRKEKESDEITSFYLEPVSEALLPLPSFRPGQYISLQLDVPSLGHRQARQYSLSSTPNGHSYRISIKRETGVHPGLVSNLLHDTKTVNDIIQVSFPHGVDFGTIVPDAPVVMISGGVGLTCLNSILMSLLETNSAQPITWIHGARFSSARAFSTSVLEESKKRDNLKVVFFNSTTNETDVHGVHYHHEGRVNMEKLNKTTELFLDNHKTQYFICGPVNFMLDISQWLQTGKVLQKQIHMELYGTGSIA